MILIDSREKFAGNDRKNGLHMHLQPLIAKGVKAEVRTLQHGDVLWIAKSR